jgi:peptidoglycan/LPS O-acetylase OafA/YrhL
VQVPFGLTIGGTLFAIGVALLLAGILANPASVPAKVLRLSPLVWAGRLSYGLYLWHFFVFTLIAGWFRGNQPWLIPAQIGATFMIAAISYYLLERPCLKLKKKFSVVKTREPLTDGPS